MSADALVLAGLLAAAVSPQVRNQVALEQSVSTIVDGKSEEPPVLSRVFWSGRDVRMEAGDELEPLVLLLDLAEDRGYRLDPPARKALLLDLGALRSRSHLGFAQAGEAMNAAEPDSFRTKPLPGGRKIAGYPCIGHRIANRDTQLEVWVSKDVPIDLDAFAEFLEWSGADLSLSGLLPELRKLGGFPLETRAHTRVEGHLYETRATIRSVTVGPRQPALFEVPADYELEDEGDEEP